MAESERQYQELFKTSPAPINLFDASGEIVWGNDAMLDLLNLDSREDLIGRAIYEFIQPDDRLTAKSELADVVNEGISVGPTRMQLRTADGTERTIRLATAPGRYEGQDIGQAVVIDITELNKIREELNEERAFIEKALDTVEDVFYVLDSAGDLERWNKALLEVSGYTEEEVLAMDVEEFFVERHAEKVLESISRAFAQGNDTIEVVVETKSGEQIPYEFRKKRLMRNGSVIGVAGIGRDITQQRTREQHLKAVDHLLQHNLRNQLNLIRGNADLLVEQEEGCKTQYLSEIHKSAEKLLSLFDRHQEIVTQVLVDGGREQIDIVAVLEDILPEFREDYPQAEFRLSSPDSVQVFASSYIEQSLRELIWNAVKHNDSATPEVDVTVRAGSTPIEVILRDNGPEIAQAEYEFTEDPGALNSTSHPSGLGLWAANLAVTYSRGSFTIRDRSTNGNEIVIELPAAVNN